MLILQAIFERVSKMGYVTDRVIEAHIYDRVRNFLARRHKIPTRIGPFTKTAVFSQLGVPRLRHCRRPGLLS
jgi:RNA-directed DNA polymerase